MWSLDESWGWDEVYVVDEILSSVVFLVLSGYYALGVVVGVLYFKVKSMFWVRSIFWVSVLSLDEGCVLGEILVL